LQAFANIAKIEDLNSAKQKKKDSTFAFQASIEG
jgi:hypothetical protein